MKDKLFTLAAALTLAAVLGTIYAVPTLAAAIKAVLVKSIDEKGRNPYAGPAICAQTAATCSSPVIGIPAVPTGSRLVVSHISGTIKVPAGTPISEFAVTMNSARRAMPHPVFQFTEAGVDNYVVNEEILVYYEAGQFPTVILNVPGGNTSLISFNVIVSGYYVDLNN